MVQLADEALGRDGKLALVLELTAATPELKIANS
jgi:hypothetical protein